MSTNLRKDVLSFCHTYFPGADLPGAFYFSDDESLPPLNAPTGHGCMVGQLTRVVRCGETKIFTSDNLGCFGAARAAGYLDTLSPDFRHFLSQGIEGVMEGERYKKTPELVDHLFETSTVPKARGRRLVFTRWDQLAGDDLPLVVFWFATPDVLSGLFTLVNYAHRSAHGVIAPFGSGCGNLITAPLLEAERDEPRGVLGMFDVSARPFVPPGILSFAVPTSLLVRMVADAAGSFLGTSSWQSVCHRLSRHTDVHSGGSPDAAADDGDDGVTA